MITSRAGSGHHPKEGIRMKMTGETALQAPPGRVRAALRDPAALARTIPGCQQLEVTAPATCRVTITAAVAATTGTYTGAAKLVSHDTDSFTVTSTLAGSPGTITATIHAKLNEVSDGTSLSYDADAEATGMIAAVGSRLLTSAADRLASQFFDSLNAELAPPAPGRPPAGAAGVASPTDPSTRGASGNTTEPRTVPCQPADRPGAVPAPTPADRPGAVPAPAARSFASGVLTGAALTLAGVILARRRTRQ
jgi:uncharacterized protein